jgi:NitT/TauT family transport system substrate-binding protein
MNIQPKGLGETKGLPKSWGISLNIRLKMLLPIILLWLGQTPLNGKRSYEPRVQEIRTDSGASSRSVPEDLTVGLPAKHMELRWGAGSRERRKAIMNINASVSRRCQFPKFLFIVIFVVYSGTTNSLAAQKIAVGYAQGAGLWPVWMAREAGYFRENGVDVDFVQTGGSNVTIAALVGGDLFLSAGGSAAGISAAAAGAPIVLIGSCGRNSFSLYTNDPTVSSVKDLRGKIVLSGPFQSDDVVLRLILKEAGMAYTDVRHTYNAVRSARYAALVGRKVAATVLSPPEDLFGKKSGFRELYDFNASGNPLMLCGIWTKRSTIQTKPETLAQLIKALIQGFARFKKDEAYALRVFRKYTRDSNLEVAEYSYKRHVGVVPKKPYVEEEGIQGLIDSSAESSPGLRSIQPKNFFDNRFVKQLDEAGFIDRLYR